jgi:putative hydrolase of the HAD superfamily
MNEKRPPGPASHTPVATPAPREPLDGVRAVLFDAGHTLLFPDYDVYRDVAREMGAPVELLVQPAIMAAELVARHEFEKIIARGREPDGAWDESYWSFFYGVFFRCLRVPDQRLPDAAQRLKELHRVDLGIWTEPAPDAHDTLAALAARGFLLGVISNSDGRVAGMLQRVGLAERLAFVIDSEVVGVSKPDARIFRMALEKTGTRPSETVYVGDYLSVDVAGSRAAGMVPVLVDPAGAYAEPGCHVVSRLGELVALLPETPGGRAPARV